MAGTVTVANKLHIGIIIRAQREIEVDEPTPSGGRRVKKWVPTGQEYPCRGVAIPFGMQANLLNNFALTPGVDADVWAQWAEANKEQDYCKNRLVFAYAKEADLVAETRAMENQRTGLEPIDTTRLAAEFRGNEKLGPLEQAPESAKPKL